MFCPSFDWCLLPVSGTWGLMMVTEGYTEHKTSQGDAYFTCDFCGKVTAKRDKAQVHLRTHTGEKPFTCNFCGKGFKTNGQLTVHVRVHTGEKPYKCQKCQMSFGDKSNLIKHTARHNRDGT